MKTKYLKLLSIILLLACIVPSVSAKKDVVVFTGKGSVRTIRDIRFGASLVLNENGDYEGHGKLAYITPNQKILSDYCDVMVIMGDERPSSCSIETESGISFTIRPELVDGETEWIARSFVTPGGYTVEGEVSFKVKVKT